MTPTRKRTPEDQGITPAETAGNGDLIWITEAMLEYGHARGWFNLRIQRGELHTYPQAGTSKVYLRRSEVEAADKKSRQA